MNKILSIGILFAGFVLLLGCSENKPRYQHTALEDTPDIVVNIYRYEKALFEIPPGSIKQSVEALQDRYSFFLGNENINQQQIIRLKDYITDPALNTLYQKVKEKYPDNTKLKDLLNPLFRFYRYYFPEQPTPDTYTYVSGIDYQNPVFIADSLTILAIDMYLGSDLEAYTKAGIPAYKQTHFEEAYIPTDIAEQLAIKEMENPVARGKFLDRMIYHGKVLYFKDALLPMTHDSIKIKYTPQQLQWTENNEKMIWTFIVENELLFSGRYSKYKKLLSDGPFTAEFGRESAPRIGHWIGWQIVRDYMEAHPSVSIKELMHTDDARQILKESGYKP